MIGESSPPENSTCVWDDHHNRTKPIRYVVNLRWQLLPGVHCSLYTWCRKSAPFSLITEAGSLGQPRARDRLGSEIAVIEFIHKAKMWAYTLHSHHLIMYSWSSVFSFSETEHGNNESVKPRKVPKDGSIFNYLTRIATAINHPRWCIVNPLLQYN